MYYPNLFNDSFVQDLFDEMFGTPYKSEKAKAALPRIGNALTDIQEFGDRFELDMDLPGYDKKDIHVELKDGYLTVGAEHEEEKEEKETPEAEVSEEAEEEPGTEVDTDDKKEVGRYIRRERYYGKVQRSFYVGDRVTQDDIKAAFTNGVLKVTVPKLPEKVSEGQTITID